MLRPLCILSRKRKVSSTCVPPEGTFSDLTQYAEEDFHYRPGPLRPLFLSARIKTDMMTRMLRLSTKDRVVDVGLRERSRRVLQKSELCTDGGDRRGRSLCRRSGRDGRSSPRRHSPPAIRRRQLRQGLLARRDGALAGRRRARHARRDPPHSSSRRALFRLLPRHDELAPGWDFSAG